LKGDLTVNSAVNFTTATAVNAQFSGSSPQTVTYQPGKTVKLNKLAFTDDDPSHVTVYNGASYVNVASIYTTYGTLYSLEEILTEVVKAEIEWELVDSAAALQPAVSGFGKGHNSTVNAVSGSQSLTIRTINDPQYTQVDIVVYAKAMGVLDDDINSISWNTVQITYNNVIHEYATNTKYNIYEINETFGWQNCWIPNGEQYAVYTGTQRVLNSPFIHACIVIFAVSGTAIYDDWKFVGNDYYDGVRFATLGAGAASLLVMGKLKSDINRDNDIKIDNKRQMIDMGVYDIDAIDKLFEYENYYYGIAENDKPDYTLFPFPSFEQYNSNSFAHGLLKAVGIIPVWPNGSLPGWCNPLPQAFFFE
jgi:hypothetical protein